MGTDLTVVNAARVSFGKKKTRLVADKIDAIGKEEFPVSWSALRE